MFGNYLKVALRNLIKNKAYSLINILGLALGIACVILILLYVRDELSYDRFQPDNEQLYRISRSWLNEDGQTSLHLARVAPPILPLLMQDYPNIIDKGARVIQDREVRLKIGDRTFIEDRLFWAENSFSDIFGIKFIQGDPQTALSEPNCLVLTQAIAQKIFGSADILGKTINYNGELDLKITGVVQDPPVNSHFRYGVLGSFKSLIPMLGESYFRTNWGSNNFLTYVKLHPNLPGSLLRERFPEFLDKQLTAAAIAAGREIDPSGRKPHQSNLLHLMPVADIHLHSHLNSEVSANGDITNIYLFAIIAFFILLIACINFMNLATARSAKRAREIGMRKVMGATRGNVALQFLGESLLITTMAALLSIAMVEMLLPWFNSFIGKELRIAFFSDPVILVGLLLLIVLVALLAGSYPAFFLSGFRPLSILKQNTRTGSGGTALFRRILVVMQFTVSIALLICMGVVYQQVRFFQTRDLGFRKENVLLLPGNEDLAARSEAFKNALMEHPAVNSVSGARLIPSDNLLNSWGVQITDEKGERIRTGFRLAVVEHDWDYFRTFGLKLVAGRGYSRDHPADDSASFIINETAVRAFGWAGNREAIGKKFQYGPRHGTVIGVAADFNFESLHNKVDPIIFLLNQEAIQTFAVNISGQDLPATLRFIEDKWGSFVGDFPFTYTFLDQEWNDLYLAEIKLGEIFGLFSVLAVIIACLGLFGLAAFAAEQRTKEIGIRKVMGASIGDIVKMLSVEFLGLVLLANVLAWPVAWYVMDRWLGNFAYRISINPVLFVGAGFAALLIALFTVSYQSYRAAIANPVVSLRYE